MEKIIDCCGLACPLSVVNAKKESEALYSGDILTVLVDHEIAVQNLTQFAEHKGFAVSTDKKSEKEHAVIMLISGAEEAPREKRIACTLDLRRKGMLVVLSANTMGSGAPKLGKSRMKAFAFALNKQDQLAVGGVTNMYNIVERMENAAQII